MEDLKQQWPQVQALLLERFGKIPDLEGILYLIGINELGSIPLEGQKFTKEQKQDLIHIGVCTVLEGLGYFRFTELDADGWPHFEPLKEVEAPGFLGQEMLLKKGVAAYLLKVEDE